VEGRLAEGELLHRRSLAIREKTFGPEHPAVAQSLNNLALLYDQQGRLAEAEPLHRQALEFREKVLGRERPDVAESLNNLGVLYRRQGRFAEAEPLYRRSLAISEKTLGPEHPNVAIPLSNQAELYRAQARHAEAQSLHRRALAIREKALGSEHPDVAASLNNLAEFYTAQGQLEEALVAIRRATAILATRSAQGRDTSDAGTRSEQRSVASVYRVHLGILSRASSSGRTAGAGASGPDSEALRVAQLARASDAADAVARMAARFAPGDDALGAAVRERQDTGSRLEAAERLLVAAASRAPAQRHAETEAALDREVDALRAKLRELDDRLDKAFPQYAELVSPRRWSSPRCRACSAPTRRCSRGWSMKSRPTSWRCVATAPRSRRR
jgi:tetratricopeptide (TPR) repeat protein